jgi:Tol biopolymer transport system component
VRTVGVVGAVALVLASAASGRSSVGENAGLVFGRSVGNIEAIYAVAADGTRLTQLSEGPSDESPQWSPDGSQIAYLRDSEKLPGFSHQINLFVMDATGHNRRQLTRGALISWFSWAPDSKEIAVADDHRGLEVVDVVTASARSLSPDDGCGPPLWSPDGQMILFDPCLDDLTVISVAAGSSRQLTDTNLARAYAWAPRGRTIAYDVFDDFFLVDSGGGTPERVASLDDPEELVWSPDGTRIATTSQRHLWVLRLADRTLTRLTSARECSDGAPAWSPDSNAIAFARCTPGPTSKVGLYRVNADGTVERRIAKVDPWMFPMRASWDPLGRPVPPKPQLALPNYLTRIYDARGRRVAYTVKKESTYWAVSWRAFGYIGTFVTGSGSHLAAKCSDRSAGTARRLSPRRWRASSGGEIRRVTARRWNVYDRRGRKIASTSGPDSPVAGFAWLALHGCHF